MEKKNKILISAFLSVIFLPFIIMLCTPGSEYLPNEGRMSNVPDDIFIKGYGVNKASTESFINDNIGFRSFSTLADITIKYELFRYYSPHHIIQGKEGQDFHTPFNKGYSDQIQPFAPLTEEQYEAAKDRLVYVNDWFNEKDIQFLFVTVPEKQSIYPEFYPDTVLVPVADARLEKFALRVGEETDIDVLDLSAELRNAKEPDEMLYNIAYDPAHWNSKGAYIGYRAVMSQLKQENPMLHVLNEIDLDISKRIESVKTADGLYTLPGRVEFIYDYTIKNPKASTVELMHYDSEYTDVIIDNSIIDILVNDGYSDVILHYENPSQSGKILLIGDSFFHQFLLPFFAESYGEVLFISAIWDWRYIRTATELFDPDTVIYEICAMNFRGSHITLPHLEGLKNEADENRVTEFLYQE